MTALANPAVRRIGTLVLALAGGYLLYLAAHPESSAQTALASFVAGVILFVAVLAVLQPFYRPGEDEMSDDEVAPAHEWKVARFLRRAKDVAPFYLGIRLFLGYEWISSSLGKLGSPAWMDTGTALQGFWERAVQVPSPPARPPITYPAYRSFIEYMLNNDWYTWFAKVVAIGELLVGLGLLLGALTAVAAAFALLMNFTFIYAGTPSTNPTFVILGAIIIYGWHVAGWWGVDRFILRLLGGSRREERRKPGQPAGGAA